MLFGKKIKGVALFGRCSNTRIAIKSDNCLTLSRVNRHIAENSLLTKRQKSEFFLKNHTLVQNVENLKIAILGCEWIFL
jgi:hypothetical protein